MHHEAGRVPVRLWEEQTNSTLRGSWMSAMRTVPLQGCWETRSPSPPDSEVPSSRSLDTSASRAERLSAETTGDTGGLSISPAYIHPAANGVSSSAFTQSRFY